MIGQEFFGSRPVLIVSLGALLAGCAQTPMGPTVQVMPGSGHSFETFQADQATCKNYAAGQVSGQAKAANDQAVGTAVVGTLLGAGLGAVAGSAGGAAGQGAAIGAAAGAGLGTGVGAANNANAQGSIQYQYDMAFSQCMAAKGDQVPGYQAASSQPVYTGPDPATVRAVQKELIRLNYLNDVADGAAGPKTTSAIRRYETATGLPVDGAPTDGLLARLQATPSGQAAAAAAPSGWVKPTTDATATPAAATAAAPAPAAPSGWVQPTTTQ